MLTKRESRTRPNLVILSHEFSDQMSMPYFQPVLQFVNTLTIPNVNIIAAQTTIWMVSYGHNLQWREDAVVIMVLNHSIFEAEHAVGQ